MTSWRVKNKKYARDVVECGDFLFYTHHGIFCDLLQYKAQKKKYINFVLYYNKVIHVHINNVQLTTNKKTQN